MMTLQQAAAWTQGTLSGFDGQIQRVVTDSREINAGDLFVALKGERFDAHAFVEAVLARGAAAMVKSDYVSAVPQASLINVVDPEMALAQLAANWCRQIQPVCIGITGSSGKTTVKEMVAHILREQVGVEAVLATAGNYNNHIGLPLTLLRLRTEHQYAVLEMGMNHAGELRTLSRLAPLQMALVNNAQRAHLGFFASTEAIAQAKAELFEGLTKTGCALLNADDAHYALFAESAAPHKLLSFGFSPIASVRAEAIQCELETSQFTLITPVGSYLVMLNVPGRHNVANALAAAAVAYELDVPLPVIARGLAAFSGSKGRLQYKTDVYQRRIIDDTYNANPDSMRAAIDVLAKQPAPCYLLMGDMGELGAQAEALHAEVGAYAKAQSITGLWAVGHYSLHAVTAFGEGGKHFPDQSALCHFLETHLPKPASVLVKGSRSMEMEKVVASLTHPTERKP